MVIAGMYVSMLYSFQIFFFFFFLSQVLTSITRSKLGSPLNGMKVVHDNTCVDYRCAYSSQGTMEVGWGWTDILKSSEYLNFFTE